MAAERSEITGNAQASKLVGPELVWLATVRDFNKPRGNLGNQALGDRGARGAPSLVAVQEQDDLPEVFAQELLLTEG